MASTGSPHPPKKYNPKTCDNLLLWSVPNLAPVANTSTKISVVTTPEYIYFYIFAIDSQIRRFCSSKQIKVEALAECRILSGTTVAAHVGRAGKPRFRFSTDGGGWGWGQWSVLTRPVKVSRSPGQTGKRFLSDVL